MARKKKVELGLALASDALKTWNEDMLPKAAVKISGVTWGNGEGLKAYARDEEGKLVEVPVEAKKTIHLLSVDYPTEGLNNMAKKINEIIERL